MIRGGDCFSRTLISTFLQAFWDPPFHCCLIFWAWVLWGSLSQNRILWWELYYCLWVSVEKQFWWGVTLVDIKFYWYRCTACCFFFNHVSKFEWKLEVVIKVWAHEKNKCNKKHVALDLEQWFSNGVPIGIPWPRDQPIPMLSNGIPFAVFRRY